MLRVLPYIGAMDTAQPGVRQPNGDLVIPARTAEALEQLLQQLHQDLARLHGQSITRPGEMETHDETAQRQDSVDKLSASAGVSPPTVVGRQMPDAHYLADTSELIERVQTLSRLLFKEP
jgi:hypothetical protein